MYIQEVYIRSEYSNTTGDINQIIKEEYSNKLSVDLILQEKSAPSTTDKIKEINPKAAGNLMTYLNFQN